MIITLSPYLPLPGSDEHLMLSRAGDVLTVNGQAFDFTPLPEVVNCRLRLSGRSGSLAPPFAVRGVLSSACGCRWLTALVQPLAFLNQC